MGSSLAKPANVESPSEKLGRLSRGIADNTRVLTERLRSRGIEPPSFQTSGLADFPLLETDTEALRARDQVVALTQELHDLVLGPREGLKNLAWDSVSYIPLQAIVEFKIAHGVPRQGSISYRDLACEVRRLAGVDVSSADLRRLLRLAMVNNIFDEPETGLVTHNRTSLLLLEDETLASWVGMFTTDLLPSVAYTVAAMKRWPGSQEPNQTVRKMRKMLELLLTARKGVNIAFNHDLAFFDHLQADEDRAIRYDMSMRVQSSREGFDPSHTVQSYPWAKLGKITVVDVGGNEGFVSVALAEAFPSLNFIVQDLPGMRLPANMGAVPPHLSDRVTLTTHDFFEPQPVVAGAYLFRHIFHAFSDKYAVQILRALVPALRPGARIIINDSVPPAPGSVSRVEEKSLRTMDVLMQTVCNSRERDVDEWRRLFELADARYRWQGAWKSSGLLWIVEVTWEG